MIDPLRPHWPTNLSIAGLLIRGLCLVVAAVPVIAGASRSLTVLLVVSAALAQSAFLAFEWMELKRAGRSAVWTVGIVASLLASLILVLVVEARFILAHTLR